MNSFQLLVAVTASCGGLLFGYEVGVMNVVLVMDAFRIFFGLHTWDGSKLNAKGENINDEKVKDKVAVYRNLIPTNRKSFVEGFITSSFVFGALCGALCASYLGEKYGRQKTIMIGACVFAIGGILQGMSLRNYLMIAVGRLITGLSVGCNSVLCPTYISEVSPAKIRGTLASCYQLMITLGIVIAAVINAIVWYFTNFRPKKLNDPRTKADAQLNNFEWRFALSLQAIPGIILAILMCFLPKSPRWLCSIGRDEEAVQILAKLNATTTDDSLVQSELKAIQEDVAATVAAGKSSIRELFSPLIRRRTFVVFFIQLFQQWTGVNVIMYYQSQIYNDIGFSKLLSTIILPVINNLVNFISTFPGMWGIERLGRKTLLVCGALMMMSFHLLTWFFSIQNKDVMTWKYLAVISIFLYVFSFASTWGPTPWVYQSEIFPLRVRVKGSAVGTMSNFFNNWIIAFVGPMLMDLWQIKTFLLFSGCCLLAFLFARYFCVESKGLNLEEVDAMMSGKAASKV